MALTKREREILKEIEASLAQVSGRPRRTHVAAALTARWWCVAPAAIALIGLAILAGLITDARTIGLASVAAGIAVGIGYIVWRDSIKRAAGD
ncbi:MAG TPA: hypothetical protein VH373_21840 [Jatrophihabitantaceae bacterium]|jgi:hypothetical protein